MKATVGIGKENKNGIWEYWNKAIGEEQYNKITEIVRECEDYYDFKEDYNAWNKENNKISEGFNKYMHLWITCMDMCKEISSKIIEEDTVDDVEIVMMQSNLKEIIAYLDTKKKERETSVVVDKMKLMKLVTKQYPVNKNNYEAIDDITFKVGKIEVTITKEDMKTYFKGVKSE